VLCCCAPAAAATAVTLLVRDGVLKPVLPFGSSGAIAKWRCKKPSAD
jgi:hypothetical protein